MSHRVIISYQSMMLIMMEKMRLYLEDLHLTIMVK